MRSEGSAQGSHRPAAPRALPRHRADPGRSRDLSGEKGSPAAARSKSRMGGAPSPRTSSNNAPSSHRRPDLNRPGARGRRLLRRDVHFALENDGWNCPFESKVHISAGRRSGDRPHRANTSPRRTVAAVGPASRGFGQGRLFGGRWCGGGGNGAGGGFMAALSCLDHLSSVGPPYSMNQEGYSGVVRVVLVGLVGLAGAWACPNLPQRRPGPGSAANETAEYQRFSSGVPARSGPLWQIWTTGAAAGPRGSAKSV